MDSINETTPTRSRAWRRFNHFLHAGRDCRHPSHLFKAEKKWKMMYTRSCKQKRATQLGFTYPVVSASLALCKALYEWENNDSESSFCL